MPRNPSRSPCGGTFSRGRTVTVVSSTARHRSRTPTHSVTPPPPVRRSGQRPVVFPLQKARGSSSPSVFDWQNAEIHPATKSPPGNQHVCLAGPIMFTAAHGLQVYRGGAEYGNKKRTHLRERWSTEVALKLSLAVSEIVFPTKKDCDQWIESARAAFAKQHFKQDGENPAVKGEEDNDDSSPPSGMERADTKEPDTTIIPLEKKANESGFCGEGDDAQQHPPALKFVRPCTSLCVWNCAVAKPSDESNLDPNYMLMKNYSQSPWHLSLEKFKAHCSGPTIPRELNGLVPLHIDFHGKLNRKSDFDLDVGWASYECMAPEDGTGGLKAIFKESLKREFTEALKHCAVKLHGKYAAAVEMDPWLSGLWGTDPEVYRTMTTQAVELGIVSTQLEIPYTMRRELFQDESFLAAFALAIANIFLSLQPPGVKAALKDPGVVYRDTLASSPATGGSSMFQASDPSPANTVKKMLEDCAHQYPGEVNMPQKQI